MSKQGAIYVGAVLLPAAGKNMVQHGIDCVHTQTHTEDTIITNNTYQCKKCRHVA